MVNAQKGHASIHDFETPVESPSASQEPPELLGFPRKEELSIRTKFGVVSNKNLEMLLNKKRVSVILC